MCVQVWRQEEEQGDRLAVDLYYEVLCPDSRSFFLYQLYPAWEVLKNIFSVNLIPYGKAYVRNDLMYLPKEALYCIEQTSS